jgi:general secretion pathway protein L
MSLEELLSQSLSRLRARFAQTPLPRFFAWWWGELRALLPERWRRLLAVEAAQLQLEAQGDELLVSSSLGHERREVARLPLAERDALPGALAQALNEEQREMPRVLLLPASTVLGFELDRQTPFKPDQVVFDSRVLRHEPGAKQVSVELALIPRDRLQQALAGLGELAGTISAVDVRGPDEHGSGYNFLPPEQRRARANTWMWINLGLIAASVLLLLLAMGRLLDNRASAVEELGRESESAHDEARSVARMRSSLEDAAAAANFLAVEKARQPSAVLLLNELSRLLPDDTWLERLNFTRGEVTMSGQSGQAAKLVEILQSSQLLRDPALSGPIQPDVRTKKDRFNITLGYGPAPDEAEEGDDEAVARR